MGSIWQEANDALYRLKVWMDTVGKGDGSTNTPPPSSGGSSSGGSGSSGSSSGSSSGGGSIGKGSKVKVTDLGANIYASSDSSGSSGTWKGAGVGSGDKLFVTNTANGRAALGYSDNVYASIGWIDLKYLQGFRKGGITPSNIDSGALAMVHSSERILTSEQTKSFEKLVDLLPRIMLPNNRYDMPTSTTNGDIIFSPIINVECADTLDVDILKRQLTKDWMRELKKLGIKTR